MSNSRVQMNRPRIYDNDTFAADIAAAIHGKAAALWSDVETFVDQLFAATATAEGYPSWAEALGIPLTYSQILGRRDGICQWLLRGGTFDRAYVEGLIFRHTGTNDFEIEESVNWITIYLPQSVTPQQKYNLMTAMMAEKPMHTSFVVMARQSL